MGLQSAGELDAGQTTVRDVEPALGEEDGVGHAGQTDSYFSLSPRAVASVAAFVAIACLGTLVIVTTIESADALSTIALALAILAFVIQIMIFVAQGQAATQQLQQGERLNAETRGLLTEIRSASLSTQTMVGAQFNQLLDAFLKGASETTREAKSNPQFEQRLIENIRAEVRRGATPVDVELSTARRNREAAARRAAATTQAKPAATSSPARGEATAAAARRIARASSTTSPQVAERIRKLSSFPSEEEAAGILKFLDKLSSDARFRLAELAEDEIQSLRAGGWVGLYGRDDEIDDNLVDLGLVAQHARRDAPGEEPEPAFSLTETGREVARLFVPTGALPGYLEGRL